MRPLFLASLFVLSAALPAAAIDGDRVDDLVMFYNVEATVEACKVAVDPAVLQRMLADSKKVEAEMGLSHEKGREVYSTIHASITADPTDQCDPAKNNMKAVSSFIKGYSS